MKIPVFIFIVMIISMIRERLLQARGGREGGRILPRPLRWIDLLLPLALVFCILTLTYVGPSILGLAGISLSIWSLNSLKVQE